MLKSQRSIYQNVSVVRPSIIIDAIVKMRRQCNRVALSLTGNRKTLETSTQEGGHVKNKDNNEDRCQGIMGQFSSHRNTVRKANLLASQLGDKKISYI